MNILNIIALGIACICTGIMMLTVSAMGLLVIKLVLHEFGIM